MTDQPEEPTEEQAELFDPVDSQLRDVPLDDVEPTGDTDASLADSIKALGTVSAPVLQLAETDAYAYRIVDGRRRIAALRAQGADEVTAHVVGPDFDSEADALTAAMNIVRNPNPLSEARAIANLLDNGYTPEALSRIGIPQQTTKKRMRLWNAPDAIKHGVAEGDIAEGTAEKVANLSPDLQEKCVQEYEEEGRLRGKDVTRIRQAQKQEDAQELEQKSVFDTPDVSREKPEEAESEPREGEARVGDPQPSPGDEHPTANVEIPTDREAFGHYLKINGVVNEHKMQGNMDSPEEIIDMALQVGEQLGLAPEEVMAHLLTPPSHFLPSDTLEQFNGRIQ